MNTTGRLLHLVRLVDEHLDKTTYDDQLGSLIELLGKDRDAGYTLAELMWAADVVELRRLRTRTNRFTEPVIVPFTTPARGHKR